MDRSLRRARRRAEGGDPTAQASHLRQRLRTGELTLESLRLAAFVGDEPARTVLDQEAPEQVPDPDRWLDALAEWGQGLTCRAALLAARACLPVYLAQHPEDGRVQDAFDLALRGLSPDPVPEQAFVAKLKAEQAEESAGHGPAHWAAQAVRCAISAVYDEASELPPGEGAPATARVALDAAVRALGDEQPVRQALARELVPWALERRDKGEPLPVERAP